MRQEQYKLNGVNYKRVNKTVARKSFDNDLEVLVAPINSNLAHMYRLYYIAEKCESINDFDKMCSIVSKNLCDPQMGQTLKYFIVDGGNHNGK